MKEVNLNSKSGLNRKSSKKIIVRPPSVNNLDLLSAAHLPQQNLKDFMNLVKDSISKIDLIFVDPNKLEASDFDIFSGKILFTSMQADYIIVDDLSRFDKIKKDQKNRKPKFGIYKRIKSNNDIAEMQQHLLEINELSFVILELDDWRIIPLENVIASLQATDVEIFAIAASTKEVETLFNVLELGVDGVLISPTSSADISQVNNMIVGSNLQMKEAKIDEIVDVGMGERVCIDTVSMLNYGEGMLVGNRSNFLFLVHNESIGSSFTSPRPFRVNAGAVHCYTLVPKGNTKYLSELESGSHVLIADVKGGIRTVVVGRSKIESRPLRLFKASISDQEFGSIIVQNAETIRFLDAKGDLLPVTHAKPGDKIMVYSIEPTGRHFGMQVSDEFILEK
jgi:3-dehydroquinate synthase II